MISVSAARRLNSSSPIPDFILLHCIAECGLNGSNGQVHKLQIWTVTLDLPWTCPLNPLYSRSAKWHVERNWGSHHWNASLRATDSLMTIQSLKSLCTQNLWHCIMWSIYVSLLFSLFFCGGWGKHFIVSHAFYCFSICSALLSLIKNLIFGCRYFNWNWFYEKVCITYLFGKKIEQLYYAYHRNIHAVNRLQTCSTQYLFVCEKLFL